MTARQGWLGGSRRRPTWERRRASAIAIHPPGPGRSEYRTMPAQRRLAPPRFCSGHATKARLEVEIKPTKRMSHLEPPARGRPVCASPLREVRIDGLPAKAALLLGAAFTSFLRSSLERHSGSPQRLGPPPQLPRRRNGMTHRLPRLPRSPQLIRDLAPSPTASPVPLAVPFAS
jgi:hypothetical protein